MNPEDEDNKIDTNFTVDLPEVDKLSGIYGAGTNITFNKN
jgi:hypothetical protein